MANTTKSHVQLMLDDAKVVHKVFLYIFPVVGTVGFVTNCMSIYIFLFCWPKRTRQTIYLSYLAFSDNLVLICPGWIYQFAFIFFDSIDRFDIAFKIAKSTDGACIFYRYLESVTSTMACTAMVLIVVDRTLSAYFPFKAARWRPRQAWIACGITTVVSIVAVLPFGILRKLNKKTPDPSTWSCSWSTPSIALQIYRSLISHVPALQTFIVLIFNIALVIKIRKQRKAMNAESGQDTGLTAKEIRASVVVILLSIFFVLCAIIQVVGFFIGFLYRFIFTDQDRTIASLGYKVGDVGWHFFFLQESTSFFIYLGLMKDFREIFITKFCCCIRRRRRQNFELTMTNLNSEKTII